MWISRLLLGTSLSLLAVAGANSRAATFTVQVLKSVSGATFTQANGINNHGQAVGGIGGSSACTSGCAVVWNGTAPTLLKTPTGNSGCSANAINDAGQVVGDALPMSGPVEAVIWNNGVPTLLNPLTTGGEYSSPAKINDSAQVVGNSTSSAEGQQAVVWNGTTPLSLGPSQSAAYGINDRGLIVGYIDLNNAGSADAVIWHGTTPAVLQKLSTDDGASAVAYAINNAGLIVGAATPATNGPQHAVFWSHSAVTDLGTLGGQSSLAAAVNAKGVIVGNGETGTNVTHAMLWSGPGGRPVDLNSLIGSAATQVTLEYATGINDACSIVANGTITKTHASAAFVLTLIDPSRCGSGI